MNDEVLLKNLLHGILKCRASPELTWNPKNSGCFTYLYIFSISRQGQVANLSATGSGRAQPHRLREGNLGAADWGSILSTGTTRIREWNLHTRGDDRPEWRCVFNGHTWYRYPYILYIYILIIYNYVDIIYIYIWYTMYILYLYIHIYIYWLYIIIYIYDIMYILYLYIHTYIYILIIYNYIYMILCIYYTYICIYIDYIYILIIYIYIDYIYRGALQSICGRPQHIRWLAWFHRRGV